MAQAEALSNVMIGVAKRASVNWSDELSPEEGRGFAREAVSDDQSRLGVACDPLGRSCRLNENDYALAIEVLCKPKPVDKRKKEIMVFVATLSQVS